MDQDRSGSTTLVVMDQRLTLVTVVTVAGAHITVLITVTFLLHVITALSMVSNIQIIVLYYSCCVQYIVTFKMTSYVAVNVNTGQKSERSHYFS